MAKYGNRNGNIYPMGKIIVSTPGTTVLLNQNVGTDSPFGTAAHMCCNQLFFQAYSANTLNIYVCFKGGSKADTNSIIVILAPGQALTLGMGNLVNNYQPDQFCIDADTANNAVQVTAVIV